MVEAIKDLKLRICWLLFFTKRTKLAGTKIEKYEAIPRDNGLIPQDKSKWNFSAWFSVLLQSNYMSNVKIQEISQSLYDDSSKQ